MIDTDLNSSPPQEQQMQQQQQLEMQQKLETQQMLRQMQQQKQRQKQLRRRHAKSEDAPDGSSYHSCDLRGRGAAVVTPTLCPDHESTASAVSVRDMVRRYDSAHQMQLARSHAQRRLSQSSLSPPSPLPPLSPLCLAHMPAFTLKRIGPPGLMARRESVDEDAEMTTPPPPPPNRIGCRRCNSCKWGEQRQRRAVAASSSDRYCCKNVARRNSSGGESENSCCPQLGCFPGGRRCSYCESEGDELPQLPRDSPHRRRSSALGRERAIRSAAVDPIEEIKARPADSSYESKTTISKTSTGVRITIDIYFDQTRNPKVEPADVVGSRIETDIPRSRILEEFQQQAKDFARAQQEEKDEPPRFSPPFANSTL